MRKVLSILFLLALPLIAQQGLISAGVTVDYVTHQPSANTSIAVKVADIGAWPTYSLSSFETALFKSPQATSQSLTLRTGFLQIPFHTPHFGVFLYTEGGIFKSDLATLGTFNGGVGIYVDVIGKLTKDMYHVWFSPMLREVSVSSRQVKPVYGFQITTVFKK